MKSFIAIVLLAALASAEYKVKTNADLVHYREECVKQLSVPADHVEKFKKWEFPNDSVTQCYMMCVLEKFELFDKVTGFNVMNVHHQIVTGGHVDHTDENHAKIEKCADKNTEGSSACEWAYRGATCFINANLPIVKQSIHEHHEHHDHAEHADHADHSHHHH